MARIAGVNIPDQKHVCIALTYIYGVGRSRALEICQTAGLKPETRVRDRAIYLMVDSSNPDYDRLTEEWLAQHDPERAAADAVRQESAGGAAGLGGGGGRQGHKNARARHGLCKHQRARAAHRGQAPRNFSGHHYSVA